MPDEGRTGSHSGGDAVRRGLRRDPVRGQPQFDHGVVERPQQGRDADRPIKIRDPLRPRAGGHGALDEGEDLSTSVIDTEKARSTGEARVLQVLQDPVHQRRVGSLRSSDSGADANDSVGYVATEKRNLAVRLRRCLRCGHAVILPEEVSANAGSLSRRR